MALAGCPTGYPMPIIKNYFSEIIHFGTDYAIRLVVCK